ncbi:MAG: cytochrome c [Thermostichus sp. DG02_5_bins_236]
MPHSLSDITESHSSPSSPGSLVDFGQERLQSQQRLQPFFRFWKQLFTGNWTKKIRWGLISLGLVVLTWAWLGAGAKLDPYTESVLNLQGQANHGASLFALNCAACHGEEADGRVGPSLRGVSSRRSERFIIHQVTSGNTPPMPQFQVDPQEMADLLSYLNTL